MSTYSCIGRYLLLFWLNKMFQRRFLEGYHSILCHSITRRVKGWCFMFFEILNLQISSNSLEVTRNFDTPKRANTLSQLFQYHFRGRWSHFTNFLPFTKCYQDPCDRLNISIILLAYRYIFCKYLFFRVRMSGILWLSGLKRECLRSTTTVARNGNSHASIFAVSYNCKTKFTSQR